MKTTTLVIMAAGLGSRYGGTKQIDAVTPKGETLLDFSIYDALAAGIEKIVFVVRSEILEDVRTTLGDRYRNRVQIEYVCQDLDDAPKRERPWGTGHAILCAREKVDEDFWVINADDFYGRSTYLMMSAAPIAGHRMAGFRLGSTLSPYGPVSRGQCIVDDAGYLAAVVERKGIVSENGEIRAEPVPDDLVPLSQDTVVSMNFWGFTPEIFTILDKRFQEFVRNASGDGSAEFYITSALNDAIANGEARVKVLRSDESWIGLTYRSDRERAAEHISQLRRRGIYPPRLW